MDSDSVFTAAGGGGGAVPPPPALDGLDVTVIRVVGIYLSVVPIAQAEADGS